MKNLNETVNLINSQVNGINGDFIFRCGFAWWLHNHLFGFDFTGSHRARADVEATTKCFIEMVKRKDINIEEMK